MDSASSLGTTGSHDMVLQLLRQLIQRMVPGGAESSRKQQQLLQYCVRVLGSRITPSVVGDEFHLIELVKKRLIKENHTTSALAFTELYRRLSGQPALHRRWSIMHVMFSLCSLQSADDSVSSAFSNLGLVAIENEHGHEHARLAQTRTPSELARAEESLVMQASKAAAWKRSLMQESAAYEVSEQVLIRDVLFCLQGIDGTHIKYHPEYDAYVPDLKLALPASTRDLLRRLCEIGWLYRHVKQYIEHVASFEAEGLMAQSLAFGFQANRAERAYPHDPACTQMRSHARTHASSHNGTRASARTDAHAQTRTRARTLWQFPPVRSIESSAPETSAAVPSPVRK